MSINEVPPPVFVTVQSGGVPTWVQISTLVIALLALGISSLQFFAGRRDQARSRPSIRCGAVFGQNYHVGGREAQQVVALHVSNLGSEATKLNALGVFTESMLLNGLNCLIGDDGERIRGGEYAKIIEPYSSTSFYVDAHNVTTESVEVFGHFGHGASFSATVGLNKSVECSITFPETGRWYARRVKRPSVQIPPKVKRRKKNLRVSSVPSPGGRSRR